MRCGLLRVHRKAFRTFNFGPENESESELCPSLSLSLSLSLSTSADGRALWRRLRRSRIPTYRGGERESTKKLCKGFYMGAKIWGGNSDNCYHPLDDPCHCLLGFL